MSAAGKNAPSASTANADAPGGDPSMEDILASIRRILNEEDTAPPREAAPAAPAGPAADGNDDDVLLLDPSMMLPAPPSRDEAPAPPAAPVIESPAEAGLVGPDAARAAASSVADLVRRLAAERTTQTHTGGPTIEDLVRAELRPILKDWLETHLPALVERLVRAEIERVVGRSTP